jgi:hypothetical protein
MELGDYVRAEKVDGESREERDGVYLGDEGQGHLILRSDLGRDYTCYKSGARVISIERCSVERQAFIKSVQKKMHVRAGSPSR